MVRKLDVVEVLGSVVVVLKPGENTAGTQDRGATSIDGSVTMPAWSNSAPPRTVPAAAAPIAHVDNHDRHAFLGR